MKAQVLDKNGKSIAMTMGCYGLGVSRIVAASIEQSHDNKGIVWPESIAPFFCAIAPINMHKSPELSEKVRSLYATIVENGIDVLLYDKDDRMGAMLTNLELIGVPHILVIGERSLATEKVEYKSRRNSEKLEIDLNNVVSFLKEL
jgi:prolyl-tRNA synthetase